MATRQRHAARPAEHQTGSGLTAYPTGSLAPLFYGLPLNTVLTRLREFDCNAHCP